MQEFANGRFLAHPHKPPRLMIGMRVRRKPIASSESEGDQTRERIVQRPDPSFAVPEVLAREKATNRLELLALLGAQPRIEGRVEASVDAEVTAVDV